MSETVNAPEHVEYDGWEYVRTYPPGERFPHPADFTHAAPCKDAWTWRQPEDIRKCWVGNGTWSAVYRLKARAAR